MSEAPKRLYEFGPYRIDAVRRLLLRGGKSVPLPAKVFETLLVLAQHCGEVVSKDELMKLVWPDSFVEESNLSQSIFLLRKALGETAQDRGYIVTMPGRGYRLSSAVRQVTASETELGVESSQPSHVDLEETRSEAAKESQPVAAVPQEERLPRATTSSALAALLFRRRTAFMAVALLILAVLLNWSRPIPFPRVIGSSQVTRDGLLKPDLLTDGGHLYFTEIAAGHNILKQVSVAGGETSQIPTPFTSFHLGGLSPSGKELLIAGVATGFPSGGLAYEFPLWVLPLPAGPPHRVGGLVVTDASWSRDGQQILFAHGHDLYICNRDGTESRKLATTPHYPFWARWSPRREIVRFTEYDPETNATWLWEVGVDGSRLHRLLPQWSQAGQECCGNWIAGGKYYLFQSAGTSWVLRESRDFFGRSPHSPIQLVSAPLSVTNSVPSTDGTKLFAVSQQRRAELVSYNARARQFVPYMSGISGGQLDFSRNGQWVTYVAYPDETLWRSRLDGNDRQQLTYPPLRAALPHWSPDGKRIAFMAAAPAERWKIFLMTADDGHMQDPLPEGGNVGDPTWSPDGNSLAFASLSVDANSPPVGIELLDLRSNRASLVSGSEGMFSPRWSPDGRYLAGITADSGKLTLFNFSTQKWSTLATHTIGYPSWSKDSRYIFFDDLSSTEDPAFYRVSISGHNLQRVVSLKDVRQFATEWPFGSWTGLTPDDLPLLQRDISTQEIYVLDLDLP